MELVVIKVHAEVDVWEKEEPDKDDFVALVEVTSDDGELYANACHIAKDYMGDGITSLNLEALDVCQGSVLDKETWEEIGKEMGWLTKPRPTAVYDKDGNEVFSNTWD